MTVSDTHYRVAKGWGMQATTVERGLAHVAMTVVMAGDDEPDMFELPIRDDAREYLSSIIADLLALADQEGLDIEQVMAKARREFRDGE